MIFGPFWVILGIRDVTKWVKILEFCIFDFIICFPSPKTFPMLIFRSKQSFYRVFWHFRWFSGHFGSFWVILGIRDVTKGVKILEFWIFDSVSSVFPPKKTYIYTFLDPNNHFFMSYWVLGWFRVISGFDEKLSHTSSLKVRGTWLILLKMRIFFARTSSYRLI